MKAAPQLEIEKYLGIPYRLGGRGFDGADCIGLVWLYFRTERGISIPDTDGQPVEKGWHRDPEARKRYARGVLEGAKRVGADTISGIDDLKKDDILAFCKTDTEPKTDENIAMLAVYIGQRRILMTTEAVETTHVVRLTTGLKNRFVKGFRICQPPSRL